MAEKYTRRDYLAQDRTHLANERTLLAYLRTSLAFLVLGAFLIKFLPSHFYITVAVISIIFGAGLIIYGTKKFFKYKEHINRR
ncbi:MAG: DUF202 domain-containing protein [Nanoarchaeota archaeon]